MTTTKTPTRPARRAVSRPATPAKAKAPKIPANLASLAGYKFVRSGFDPDLDMDSYAVYKPLPGQALAWYPHAAYTASRAECDCMAKGPCKHKKAIEFIEGIIRPVRPSCDVEIVGVRPSSAPCPCGAGRSRWLVYAGGYAAWDWCSACGEGRWSL